MHDVLDMLARKTWATPRRSRPRSSVKLEELRKLLLADDMDLQAKLVRLKLLDKAIAGLRRL